MKTSPDYPGHIGKDRTPQGYMHLERLLCRASWSKLAADRVPDIEASMLARSAQRERLQQRSLAREKNARAARFAAAGTCEGPKLVTQHIDAKSGSG